MHAFRFHALLTGRLTRLKDIECSKEDLISHYASIVPQGVGRAFPRREESKLQDDVFARRR